MNENSGRMDTGDQIHYRLAYVLCLGVVILFLVLNLMTPLIVDDYTYSSCRSLYDVANATYDQYFNWGGRVIGHFLTYFWLFVGKSYFNIANVAVYCLFVYLIQFHITGKAKFDPVIFLVTNVFLWFFVPAWGQNFLWLSGSCVYLWTTAFILLYLVPYRKKAYDINYRLNIPLSVLFVCLGIFAGCSTENASAGVFFLLISYFAVKIAAKRKLALFEITGAIGFLIGFLLIVLSPGNEMRQGMVQHYGDGNLMFLTRLVGVTLVFGKDMGFALLAAFGILAFDLTYNKKRRLNIFIYFYALVALAGAFSMFLSPSFPPRAFLIVTVFAGIALGNVLLQTGIKMPVIVKRNAVAVAATCLIALSFSFFNSSRNFIGVYMEWNKRVMHIKEEKANGNLDIEVRAPIPVWDKHVASHGLHDIKHDKDEWPNNSIAKYFGLSSIRAVSKDDWEVMWFK